MAMRVTNNMLFLGSVSGMQTKFRDLRSLQEQSVTGLRVNKPSDDPAASFRHTILSSELSEVKSMTQTSQVAGSRLRLGEEKIGMLHENMLKAQDVVLQLGNDHMEDASIMKSIAFEVQSLFEETYNTTNSEIDGVPLFAGGRLNMPYDLDVPVASTFYTRKLEANPGAGFEKLASTSYSEVSDSIDITHGNYPGMPASVRMTYDATAQAFNINVNGSTDPSSPVAYTSGTAATLDLGWMKINVGAGAVPSNGDAVQFEVIPKYQGGFEDRKIKISDQNTVPGNVTGDQLINGTDSREVNLFAMLSGLRGALLRGDAKEVTAWLPRIQEGRSQVNDWQAVTGLRSVQLESVSETLAQDDMAIQETMSSNSEADVFEILSRLEQNTQAMQVLTLSERRILDTSLVDFIR